MKNLINNFPNQIEEAIQIGQTIAPQNKEIDNVVIAGMGGSGIGGKIVSQLLADVADITIQAFSDYSLPKFANKKTLLIISSYSGNTEETVNVLQQGLKRGCQIACISSGGQVAELARDNNLLLVSIPGGNPPRAMFAYSFTQQLFVLKAFGIIDGFFENELLKSIQLLTADKDAIIDIAKDFAHKLKGRIPVLYSDTWLEGSTKRWCQQINENSKMLCWNNTFPEMNHNELVGWESTDNRNGFILFRTPFDNQRSQLRMDICMPIFTNKCDTILTLNSKGDSKIETALYCIYVGDWMSWFLSEINKVDATEIKNIIYLKDSLAKV